MKHDDTAFTLSISAHWHEDRVWTHLLLIISDLDLLKYYRHASLPWNGTTDKAFQDFGFKRRLYDLKATWLTQAVCLC